MDSEPPKSLRELFREAEEKRSNLEGAHEASSPSYKADLVAAAIRDYQACLQMIHQLALFSPNEGLEDVSTSDLPYLLVNYHLAELCQKVASHSPQERRASLGDAREAYERFLGVIDNYSMLPEPYAKLYSRYTDDPLAFSATAEADPAARRNAKIAGFRAEKELRAKLELLRRNPGYEEEGGGGGGGDEELVRGARLAEVALCVHMAFQGLDGINRELEILKQATLPLLPQTTSVEEDERRRQGDRRRDGYTERLDPPLTRLQSLFGNPGPILSKEGRPLQPFTLVSTRQEMRDGVFRPGHNLPTMSIDEYLEEERRRGGFVEGGGEASMRQPEPDEDDMDKADEETMKARQWDEFKEANPRGAGNTLNRG